MYDADGICWHSRFAECHIRHFNDEFFLLRQMQVRASLVLGGIRGTPVA